MIGQSKDAINYSGYMQFETRFCCDRSWETEPPGLNPKLNNIPMPTDIDFL